MPHLLLSFLSLPMCLNTVDRPKSETFTVSGDGGNMIYIQVHGIKICDIRIQAGVHVYNFNHHYSVQVHVHVHAEHFYL